MISPNKFLQEQKLFTGVLSFLRDNKNSTHALGFIFASKASVVLIGVVGFIFFSPHLQLPINLSQLVSMWGRSDWVWYLHIATNGYQTFGPMQYSAAFLPLYPGLIALTTFIISKPIIAALTLTHIFSFVGLFAFYHLAKFEFGHSRAIAALVSLTLFPTAYFFASPYTEGIALFLVIVSIYAARRGKWMYAGLYGGLAMLTRVTTVAIIPALVIEFFLQRKEKGQRWRDALWLLLIPLLFSSYLWGSFRIYDTPFAYTDALRDGWHKQIAWPTTGIKLAIDYSMLPLSQYSITAGLAEYLAVITLIIATALSFIYLRLSYATYMLVFTLLVASTSLLQSTPRYLLLAFPVFFLLGALSQKQTSWKVWITISVGLLTILTSTYVTGSWAF